MPKKRKKTKKKGLSIVVINKRASNSSSVRVVARQISNAERKYKSRIGVHDRAATTLRNERDRLLTRLRKEKARRFKAAVRKLSKKR